MEKQFNKMYALNDLAHGDRFYFVTDKKKVVHEVKIATPAILIKTDRDQHFTLTNLKQRNGPVIFLRHAGVK
jgi:hypothetical protein